MTLFNSVFTWFMKKRIHQIELFMKYPNEVQEEWFEQLISGAEKTEWGRKYGYKSITHLEQFKERVPIQNYDTLKPYIERMLKGEQNVLWPSEIRWFAKSSGTTSDRSKFIPVSEESLEECHFKGGKDLLTIYFNNVPNARMFTGKILTLGGSYQVSELSADTSFGDLSAVLMKNLPLWAELHRTPHMDIALLDNFEEKIEKMAYATKDVNVTSLSGVPTWNILLFKRILEITGKKNLLEVWPNLELYFHGAVNFTPYREQFKKLIPIFIAHQHELALGELILDRFDLNTEWSIHASTLEEFVEKGVIKEVLKERFINSYKNPHDFMCVFVVVPEGANFVYVPYVK